MTPHCDFRSIAVVGAGAVGSFFGAMLARAGHRVVLIGRPPHVEAIRRDEYTGRLYTFFADPDGLPLELYEAD